MKARPHTPSVLIALLFIFGAGVSVGHGDFLVALLFGINAVTILAVGLLEVILVATRAALVESMGKLEDAAKVINELSSKLENSNVG